MKTFGHSLAAMLLCLAVLLCVLIFGACQNTNTPPAGTDTAVDSATSPDTPAATTPETEMTTMPAETQPETGMTTMPAETQPETQPESASETQTPAESESESSVPETVPESEPETESRPEIEDPALNVYPTDGKFIDIGAFFEPDAAHTTAEHYDWLKAAHITYVDSVNWDTAITEEINLLQAELCAERGIRLSYYPRRYGIDLNTMSNRQIEEYCLSLMEKNSSITDLHVIDEPAQPWVYARVLNAVSAAGMTPRINFLPYVATAVFENYHGHVEDTVIAVGKENYPTLYFDHYPYDLRKGSIPDMFYNMNVFREIGLKYDLPTGLYLQAFGDSGCRRPNADEIRYQASAALAYGFQSLTYFTWWTTNPPENTHNYAIIAPDGSKTDLYDSVVEINGQITVTGALLAHLEALEVYHTAGAETGIILRDEDELPLFPASSGQFGFVVSLMEDPDTGRDYIMLVNKNFKKEVTTTVTVSDAITYLYDCTNGAYESIDISSGTFEATFLPGGYMLLAVGQHDNIVDRQLDKGLNLAEGKSVAVSAVNPGSGYYAYCLTDGLRTSDTLTAAGYRSAGKTGYVEIDLGRAVTINRVDMYTLGTVYEKGDAFPKAFTIEVSTDGESWTTVITETDYNASGKIPVFTFDSVEARYVRMNVTECASGRNYFEIAEIEIYNDDGSIPQPDESLLLPPTFEAGENIATDSNVKVICSSAYQESTYWRISGINDGRKFDVNEGGSLYCGYSSNVFVNKEQAGATEWIGYDFGTEYNVSSMIVYPAKNSQATPQGFPLSYCVEISEDGVNWTSILTVENDPDAGKMEAHTLTFDTVSTRYIRFRGTLLTGVGDNALFGYMLQLSEIEVIAG